jgi:hypothetical protein
MKPIYIHIHTCKYIYVCIYVYIYICIYMCVYIYINICICIYTYIYKYIYMFTVANITVNPKEAKEAYSCSLKLKAAFMCLNGSALLEKMMMFT